MNLETGRLSVEISSMEGNDSTRFEHLPFISSIMLDSSHSFLSKEMTLAGPGTGGQGLMHGFLNLGEMDTKTADGVYPVIGTGMVHLPQGETYSIRKNYICDFAQVKCLGHNDISASFLLVQKPCHQIAYEIQRTFSVMDNHLRIDTDIRNTGLRTIDAKQYCHNFFLFDGLTNGSSYEIGIPGCHDVDVVRGSVVLGKDWYRPNEFDKALGTIAIQYKIDADENETLRISNSITKTSVEINNQFSVLERYHWHSPWSLCPESFVKIHLKRHESCSFSRNFFFYHRNT